MRIGLGLLSARRRVDDSRETNAVAADILIKRRRFIISNLLVIPSEVEESLAVIFQHSRCLDLTK
jgi:hypothetical protein